MIGQQCRFPDVRQEMQRIGKWPGEMIVNNIGPLYTALEFRNPGETESAGGYFKIQLHPVHVPLGVMQNGRMRPGTGCEYPVADTELRCPQGYLSYRLLHPALGIRKVSAIDVQNLHPSATTTSLQNCVS